MSKKKYCKLCNPDIDLIDEDDPIAIGYYIKGKRKIPVCEMCLESVKQYHETGYYDESRNVKEEKIICDHGKSNYEKKNLVVIDGPDGAYDIMKCNICGNEKNRYGLSNHWYK